MKVVAASVVKSGTKPKSAGCGTMVSLLVTPAAPELKSNGVGFWQGQCLFGSVATVSVGIGLFMREEDRGR